MSKNTGRRSGSTSAELPNVKDNFKELARLRSAESKAADKIASAEATSKRMLDEADFEGRRLLETEIDRIRTELEEKYIIEERKVHEEQKQIISYGEEKARGIRSKGEARIDNAIEAIIKKILEGGA